MNELSHAIHFTNSRFPRLFYKVHLFISLIYLVLQTKYLHRKLHVHFVMQYRETALHSSFPAFNIMEENDPAELWQ